MVIFHHHLEWKKKKKKETNFPLLSHSNIKLKNFEKLDQFMVKSFP